MHVYNHHLETHDWFLKGDDDTMIVWPHLMNFIAGMTPSAIGKLIENAK
jgi:hypothetical protein